MEFICKMFSEMDVTFRDESNDAVKGLIRFVSRFTREVVEVVL